MDIAWHEKKETLPSSPIGCALPAQSSTFQNDRKPFMRGRFRQKPKSDRCKSQKYRSDFGRLHFFSDKLSIVLWQIELIFPEMRDSVMLELIGLKGKEMIMWFEIDKYLVHNVVLFTRTRERVLHCRYFLTRINILTWRMILGILTLWKDILTRRSHDMTWTQQRKT